MASAGASISRSIYEEPATTVPIIESTMYEFLDIEETTEIKVKEEPVQTAIEEKPIPPKEVIVREVKEVPFIPVEKLDMIINGINSVSQALRGVKNVASNIHYEIKDIKKDQKEINPLLRDIRDTFDKIKAKKGWFRFL